MPHLHNVYREISTKDDYDPVNWHTNEKFGFINLTMTFKRKQFRQTTDDVYVVTIEKLTFAGESCTVKFLLAERTIQKKTGSFSTNQWLCHEYIRLKMSPLIFMNTFKQFMFHFAYFLFHDFYYILWYFFYRSFFAHLFERVKTLFGKMEVTNVCIKLSRHAYARGKPTKIWFFHRDQTR